MHTSQDLSTRFQQRVDRVLMLEDSKAVNKSRFSWVMYSYSCRSQDRVDDPSGAAFRQRFRSRSHVRYSMKTFLSLVPAGSGGCSTLLAIPAARRRGSGSRGEILQGFALSRSEYGGLRERPWRSRV